MKDDQMVKRFQDAKKVGVSKEDAWDIAERSTKTAAKNQGWDNAELAATLAGYQQALEKVYGKDEKGVDA